MNERRLSSDTIIPCNDETTVLVDSGRIGKSLIFEYALGMVNSASSKIRLITQYTPNGTIADALYAAYKDGIDVKVLISEHKSIAEWFGRGLDSFNEAITKVKRKGLSP